MKVVFLAPSFPPEMQQYTRGLAEVGAEVYGVGDTPRGNLPASLKRHLSDYLEVPRLLDDDDVVARVTAWLRGREVDRVLANWEVMVLTAARLRERFGLPGMSVDAVQGFRDKQLMKERVQAAGLRTPRAERVRTVSEARAAAGRIGYPLILKPIAGAGSADTYKVTDPSELESALNKMGHVEVASCEEFISGEEFTFDSVSIGGKPAYYNVAQYLPPPLIARSEEWVSPIIITVRDLEQPKLQDGIALGKKVLGALGMGDGFTHMEWFRKPDGEVVFGEIGCRPGGAHLVDQMNYTCGHRPVPRVGPGHVLGKIRGAHGEKVQRRHHLQAGQGPRPHHAHRGPPRVHARLRRARRRGAAPAGGDAAPQLEAHPALRRAHPVAPPRLGHDLRDGARGRDGDHAVRGVSEPRPRAGATYPSGRPTKNPSLPCAW